MQFISGFRVMVYKNRNTNKQVQSFSNKSGRKARGEGQKQLSTFARGSLYKAKDNIN
jgi:hypothetical protein